MGVIGAPFILSWSMLFLLLPGRGLSEIPKLILPNEHRIRCMFFCEGGRKECIEEGKEGLLKVNMTCTGLDPGTRKTEHAAYISVNKVYFHFNMNQCIQ